MRETGCGKTYKAKVLGASESQSGYKASYVLILKLFGKLEASRIQVKYPLQK